MRYYVHGPVGGPGSIVFGIVGFIFWAAVIGLLVMLVVKHHHLYHTEHTPPQPTKAKETPLEIAQARYARGEITSEEYAKLKEDLSPS